MAKVFNILNFKIFQVEQVGIELVMYCRLTSNHNYFNILMAYDIIIY